MKTRERSIKVIDLFCGIGGLTYGLIKSGLEVVAGIDNDLTCKYGYEYNNGAQFIHKDVIDVTPAELRSLFGDEKAVVRVLVGCAPCQPFSGLNVRRVTKQQLQPLQKFSQLVEATLPDIVSMENVAGLANDKKYPVFRQFLNTLDRCEYKYEWEIVETSEYGVPQSRKRLVLLASRLGEIALVPRTHKNKKVTVRDVISGLPAIKDGEVCTQDPLHRASELSPLNRRRISATHHDGGNSSDWKKPLKLKCHQKPSGKSYRSTVYGRMRWDDVAPTMTTQCVGLGNGRFGHPDQDRAISLREAALLQTFPKKYRFIEPKAPVFMTHVARFIGNAVPVRMGVIIGRSIKQHVSTYVR